MFAAPSNQDNILGKLPSETQELIIDEPPSSLHSLVPQS